MKIHLIMHFVPVDLQRNIWRQGKCRDMYLFEEKTLEKATFNYLESLKNNSVPFGK